MVFSLVYVSSATTLMSPEELAWILATSRVANAAIGVTGMLLYKDGNIMQVLEGERGTVTDLYERIALDPRHSGIITLLEDEQPDREFGDWSMAFGDLDRTDPASVPGYSDFLSLSFSGPELAGDPGRARFLLRTFRESIR